MTNAAPPPPLPAQRVGLAAWPRFLASFWALAGPYWRSEQRWRARGLTGALVLLTIAQVVVAILLNLWNEHFFNALEQRALDRFVLLIAAFIAIVAINVAITTAHLVVKRHLQVGWRAWLTQRLLGQWMAEGRPYQLAELGGPQDNPDARIAEDIRIATEYAVDLAHVAVFSSLILISFVQILWTISGTVTIALGGASIDVPGYMVWIAAAYAVIGTWVAFLLGRPLTLAADRRQAAEADFRFGLIHARANALALALVRGEVDERRRLLGLFADARTAWDRQTKALRDIFFYITSWPMMSQMFPILVAAPRYIGGSITLGTLMQSAQAFQQVTGALSWPIDNQAKAADWRASVERVQGLAAALRQVAAPADKAARQIAIVAGGRPALAFHNLAIDERDGAPAVAPMNLEIAAGERILLVGEAGTTGKLFRAVAGLWSWGDGRIATPSDGPIYFLPERPYLPQGKLGTAVCYPTQPDGCGPREIAEALGAVGLEPLAGRLDDSAPWEQILNVSDQQRLGFARLLLHKPRWIFVEHATDALDGHTASAMMQLMLDRCPGATLLTIGQHDSLEQFHTRKFELRRQNGVAELREIALAGKAAGAADFAG